MIPITLTLRGFLSYKNETIIDFSNIEVACISGPNGAGKSSLFDAITWALFGRARRSDDALIHDGCESCLVMLEFDYEDNRYRVQREKSRGRGAILEFQIRNVSGEWKPLTEAGIRATEDRICDILRMDYDTFVNASFFLQGKADMFTQQAPAKRKEILGSILGLEIWEAYREEATKRRRKAEEQAHALRAWLAEVEEELTQENERRERLRLLSDNLITLSALREEKERQYSEAQARIQSLRSEESKFAIIQSNLDSSRSRLAAAKDRIQKLSSELESYERTLMDEKDIQNRYEGWLNLRNELERWNNLALRAHALSAEKAELEAAVRAEEARLKQEAEGLKKLQSEIIDEKKQLFDLQKQLDNLKNEQREAECKLAELPALKSQVDEVHQKLGELEAKHETLKGQIAENKERIKELESLEGGVCPLCGQALTEVHKRGILQKYRQENKKLDEERDTIEKVHQELILAMEKKIFLINQLELIKKEMVAKSQSAGAILARIDSLQVRQSQWEKKESLRFEDIKRWLSQSSFAAEKRKQIASLQERLTALGYDETAHNEVLARESELRTVEDKFRKLEKARVAVEGLRREIASLEENRAALKEEVMSQEVMAEAMQKELLVKKEGLPNLTVLNSELESARNEENRLRTEVGAAQQMVNVLETQRKRKSELAEEIEKSNLLIAKLKMLETAFGKDGVPALLIEQALPEIESQANELLDRLSDGRMSVSFETERAYKDKKREDRRQTLDILISDASGRREYELFSGGEAFRINFAIRLALSQMLAGRAGARLQTLVIDEGFGSQDAEGRQRLIEAINLVSQDFAKILVITHLDELKDAFPSLIEISKVNGSSIVEVIP